MKYNMIDVGRRIKEERLKNGYKRQDDLCGELHIGRNTLSAWENGKANLELHDLMKLCELFDCEVGYLMCEYDTPYRVQSDISEQTQLSVKAIQNIMKLRDNHKRLFGNRKNSLDALLSSDDFIAMLEKVEEYRTLKSSDNVDKNMIDAKAFGVCKDFINIIDKM